MIRKDQVSLLQMSGKSTFELTGTKESKVDLGSRGKMLTFSLKR
jgi:hypothetical protein